MSKDEWEDDFDEEAEARERYGDAYPEPKSAPPYEGGVAEGRGGSFSPATEHTEPTPPVLATDDEQLATDNQVNYHYVQTLTDAHLPHLDFYRCDNIFSVRTANSWLAAAATAPDQLELFGDFWNEGELGILFSDTGKGKSILAIQIAESIASGIAIDQFKLAAPAQRVLFFDFEFDERQFGQRYSTDGCDAATRIKFKFADNLIRARIGQADEIPPEFKNHYDYLEASVASLIEFTAAKVVIVDNITWLNSSTLNTNTALRLMKVLKHLKTELGLSILVLAHTPKRYHKSPLSVNDLQGSKMLSNFADNIFALGESQMGRDVRYLKHLKLRNSAVRFDGSKVCTLKLGKMPGINLDKPATFRAKHASGRSATESTENTEAVPASKSSPPYKGGEAGGRRPGWFSLSNEQPTTNNEQLPRLHLHRLRQRTRPHRLDGYAKRPTAADDQTSRQNNGNRRQKPQRDLGNTRHLHRHRLSLPQIEDRVEPT